MFDTFHDAGHRLSHDLPCSHCGHARHTYLACSDSCDCVPAGLTPHATLAAYVVTSAGRPLTV